MGLRSIARFPCFLVEPSMNEKMHIRFLRPFKIARESCSVNWKRTKLRFVQSYPNLRATFTPWRTCFMWLWLLIQLAPFQPTFNRAWALESGTSNGPVSAEEGRILWQDGRKAFNEGNYKDAVSHLQRLIDRYPGFSGYLEAHLYLGRSLMLVGRPEDAEAPLKYYINATGNRPLG